MKLSICSDCLGGLSFEAMLDEVAELGVAGVEMTGGGWSPAPHLRAAELLADAGKRKTALSAIESRGLEIAALNVSGNPLDPGELGEKHKADTERTIQLAGEFGVKKIVMMSGLTPASPRDRIPNGSPTPSAGRPRSRTASTTNGTRWRSRIGKHSWRRPRSMASRSSRSRTSARCSCGTRKPCSGCAVRWVPWSA
jgi:sugar phosphate isomerase/epimerase